jgi:hypothetical protein
VPAFFPGVLEETAAGGFPSSSDGKRDGGIFPVTGVGGLRPLLPLHVHVRLNIHMLELLHAYETTWEASSFMHMQDVIGYLGSIYLPQLLVNGINDSATSATSHPVATTLR